MKHRSKPFSAQYRRTLLGVVLLMHGTLLAGILTLKPGVLHLPEQLLMVNFIESSRNELSAPGPVGKPLPVAVRPKPIPTPTKPTPKPALPRTTAAPQVMQTIAGDPVPEALTAQEEPEDEGDGGGGGGGGGARFDADSLGNPAPRYPSQSRRLGEEGKVILRVLVSHLGHALQVELDTSSGSKHLDDSALHTVRRWRFIPAQRDGINVESWVRVPILFRLEQ